MLNVQPSQGGSSGSSGSSERIEIGWLAQHWDELTLSDEPRLTGRINVNTAPAIVLASLPGMTEDTVEAIRQRRQGPHGPFLSVGELYTSKTLSEEQFKKLAERLCVRGGAFEIRSTGVTPLGVRRQIVAVVDRWSDPVSILYWYQSE